MVIGTALNFPDLLTIVLAIVLAFMFGYGFTLVPLMRSGMAFREALRIALAADTVSIASMEIVDNLILIIIPGALMAGLDSMLFWGSLAVALFVAFLVTVPVNHWLISRGRGHVIIHGSHGDHASRHTHHH